ncbi:hypothetical protein PCE1_001059 [Barthelona sp. PCE]
MEEYSEEIKAKYPELDYHNFKLEFRRKDYFNRVLDRSAKDHGTDDVASEHANAFDFVKKAKEVEVKGEDLIDAEFTQDQAKVEEEALQRKRKSSEMKNEDFNDLITKTQASRSENGFSEAILSKYEAKERFNRLKQQVGSLSLIIIQKPKEVSNIQLLFDVLLRCKTDAERRLLHLSLCSIFTDILPVWALRDEDMDLDQPRLTKLIRKEREYNIYLLDLYSRYVKILTSSVSKSSTALKCLGELILARPEFNKRDDILECLISVVNKGSDESKKAAVHFLRELIKIDRNGFAVLSLLRFLNDKFKRRLKTGRVANEWWKVLISLKLNRNTVIQETQEHFDKKQKKEIHLKRRRRMQELKKLERDSLQVQVDVSNHNRKLLHTEMLSILFNIIFRVFKNFNFSWDITPLFFKTVETFLPLVNLELVENLLGLLSDLVIQAPSHLACRFAALQLTILTGPMAAFNIDLYPTYNRFYELLLELPLDEISVLEVLELLNSFLKKKGVMTTNRVIAFVKRLCQISLHLAPHEILAVLAFVYQLFVRYPEAQSILDDEEIMPDQSLLTIPLKGIAKVKIDLNSVTPEHCKLDELDILTRHWHEGVSNFARAIKEGDELSRLTRPEYYWEAYKPVGKNIFNPQSTFPKLHKRVKPEVGSGRSCFAFPELGDLLGVGMEEEEEQEQE